MNKKTLLATARKAGIEYNGLFYDQFKELHPEYKSHKKIATKLNYKL